MKAQMKCIVVLCLVAVSTLNGTNVWDLFNQLYVTDLGLKVVAENSMIDRMNSNVEAVASLADQVSSVVVPVGVSGLDGLISSLDVTTSLLEQVDLSDISSRIDLVASEVEVLVQPDFIATWTLTHAVAAQAGQLDSAFDSAASAVDTITSSIESLAQGGSSSFSSGVDALVSWADGLASCCENTFNTVSVGVNGEVGVINSHLEQLASNAEEIATSLLPALQTDLSVVESQMATLEQAIIGVGSRVDRVESTIDIISAGGAPLCSAVSLKQSDFMTTYTIATSGYYCLAEDVTGAILISASNVSLDLNGHTIVGVAGADSVIRIFGDAVHVYNGRLKDNGLIIGVMDVSGTANSIEDVQLYAPLSSVVPCLLTQGSSIVMNRCAVRNDGTNSAANGVSILFGSMKLIDSTVSAKNGAVSIGSCENILINGCSVHSDDDSGIAVQMSGVDIVIANTRIVECGTKGIAIGSLFSGTSFSVIIQDCCIERCGDTALEVYHAQRLTIENSSFVANAGTAIFCSDVMYASIARNNILNNSQYGIDIDATCSEGIVEYNTIITCAAGGIRMLGTNYSIEHNDLTDNGPCNLVFVPATGSNNVIVSNNAFTLGTSNTGNYSNASAIPTLQWKRPTAVLTVISGGTAVTEWHNWSSIA